MTPPPPSSETKTRDAGVHCAWAAAVTAQTAISLRRPTAYRVRRSGSKLLNERMALGLTGSKANTDRLGDSADRCGDATYSIRLKLRL